MTITLFECFSHVGVSKFGFELCSILQFIYYLLFSILNRWQLWSICRGKRRTFYHGHVMSSCHDCATN